MREPAAPEPPYRTPAAREAEAGPSAPAEIGALRRSHPAVPLRRVLRRLLLPVAFPLIGVPLVAGGGWDVALLVVGVSCVMALVAVWRPLRERVTSIDVHADGVVVVRGAARDEVAFDDVDQLWLRLQVVSSWLGSYAGITAVTLVDHGGARFVPLGVENAIDVTRFLIQRCSLSLAPEALRAVREGEELTFADVAISREGIRVGPSARPWSEVRLVRLRPGHVAFFTRWPIVPWKTVRLDRIPHPVVFTRVVQAVAPRVEIDDPLSKWGGGE